ncbi:MAG: Smr/MutS family protein [Gammaproteobacteria bacterium]|nr:Smr/MutS family protein [Gammaproteobacteria bacterium]
MKSEKKNSDDTSFSQLMGDVTPLPAYDRIDPVPRMTPAQALQREKDDRAVLQELLDDPGDVCDAETGEELLFLKAGYQKRVLRRLRKGQYSVADTIDLHHMSVATAKQVLLDFIDHALDRRQACIRVIHGKGLRSRNLPLLKMMTNKLLQKHSSVVAFASCRPVDGGTGATNVLLTARRSAAP